MLAQHLKLRNNHGTNKFDKNLNKFIKNTLNEILINLIEYC